MDESKCPNSAKAWYDTPDPHSIAAAKIATDRTG